MIGEAKLHGVAVIVLRRAFLRLSEMEAEHVSQALLARKSWGIEGEVRCKPEARCCY